MDINLDKRKYADHEFLLPLKFMEELHLHYKNYKVYYSLQCQTNYYAFPLGRFTRESLPVPTSCYPSSCTHTVIYVFVTLK